MTSLVGGRYRLDQHIATGGMGEVWRATDSVLGRAVAVKLLKPEYADDAVSRARFEAEAQHTAQLHHPGIASIFDFGEHTLGSGDTTAYLVMELVDGRPLSALLQGGEPLETGATTRIIAGAADAVQVAHDAGIVHRDIKPANLLINPDGAVKVTDFGIARAGDGVPLTQTGEVVGTPHYLAPEQAEGRAVTPASDIYALGVVLYECLSGRRPFDGSTPVAVALAHLREQPPPLSDRVPAGLAAACMQAMAKDPGQRHESASAFATAVRAAPSQSPATKVLAAPAAGAAGYPTATMPVADGGAERRRPGWLLPTLGVAAVIVVLAAALAIAGTLSGPSSNPPPGSDETGTVDPTPSQPTPNQPTPSQPTPSQPTTEPSDTKDDDEGRDKRDGDDDKDDDKDDEPGKGKGHDDRKGRTDRDD